MTCVFLLFSQPFISLLLLGEESRVPNRITCPILTSIVESELLKSIRYRTSTAPSLDSADTVEMEQEHEEHEVYGGDIPDDVEMDADFRVEDEEDQEGHPHDPNHSNKVFPICVSL